MTASALDLDLTPPDVHTRKTLDMTFPVVDVGRCPNASEPTIVGHPPPARLPSLRAICLLPPLDSCCDDDLSDLAANAYDNVHDLDVLTRSSPHVRAILGLFGRLEMRADNVETLRNNVRILSRQLTTSQDVGQAFRAKAEELNRLLTIERQCSTQAVLAHTQTLEMLSSAVRQECAQRARGDELEARLHEAEILRVAAQQDLEDMRAVAIQRGHERDDATRKAGP